MGVVREIAPGITEWAEFERRVHRTAVEYLLEEGDESEAMALLSSEFRASEGDSWNEGWTINVVLTCDKAVYETLARRNGEQPRAAKTIQAALDTVLPHDVEVNYLTCQMRLLEVDDEHWRETLMDKLRGQGINNQGIERGTMRAPHQFEGLRYRSKAEVAVAQALEVTDAAYWPNCLARLGLDAANRRLREADFLIHRRGKWGILEVDGVNYHGGNAAQDHARDRAFLQHGHLLIQRFPAKSCLAAPADVVAEFFGLLANSKA